MNYRHAFHAGNFADVMKHVLLARILDHLRGKPKPFRVIDTHAGIGLYDLAGPEALRTGEWRDGVGRLEAPMSAAAEVVAAPYRAALAEVRRRHGPTTYPGSPALARLALRPGDRAILIERHPEDAAVLRDRFGGSGAVTVLPHDGWTALRGLIPPKERRGLVLVDPPYEAGGELSRGAARLADAVGKWPTGIFALWYPIKVSEEIDAFAGVLARTIAAPAVRLELLIAEPDGNALAGSGLVVVNPPWQLAADARAVLPALADRLGRRGPGDWLCQAWGGS